MTIEVAVLVLLSGSKERKRRHNENMFKTKVIYNQAEKSFFFNTVEILSYNIAASASVYHISPL